MNTQEYLKNLLDEQNVESGGEEMKGLEAHKKEVTDFLRQEFGEDPVIKYAGSYAKGTMIKESYDLDIACYFPSSDTRSLKEIHDDVANHLKGKYLIEEKTSAVRITNLKNGEEPHGYHIDVVPGRFIAGSSDVFLHITHGEQERIQTNLKTHIDYIVKSGCTEIIKLTKLWSHRNNLKLKTFVLELFVVNSLSGFHEKDNLEKAFTKVLESFRDEFSKTRLVDPANSANVVSDFTASSQKVLTANAAKEVFKKLADDNSASAWKTIFRDDSADETLKSLGSFAPRAIFTRDRGEQFLSDLNIKEVLAHTLTIDATVKQDGFRPFNLRGSANPLKKKRKLEFFIEQTSVADPYDIKWKVKNTGSEASSVGDLRGEITDDMGFQKKYENTKYTGEHYVECYLIQGDVCIAKDRIVVPITNLV